MTRDQDAGKDEIEQWLDSQIRAGFGADDLTGALVRAGHPPNVARRRVDAAFAGRARPVPAPEPTPPGDDDNYLDIDGHRLHILLGVGRPRVVLFGAFLADDEARGLIDLASARLERSPVVDPHSGEGYESSERTSMGAMFQRGETPLLARIERRIAAVTGVPVEHGEGLQVLRYGAGGEYQPHHDFFDPARPGEARQVETGGQRIATLVMYLNTVQVGGATAFPTLGMEVAPVTGNAVFFVYRDDQGRPDPMLLHAGLPVARGEKWIATKWLRERPYR